MTPQDKRYITCGMYAFSDRLRKTWQALFTEFLERYPSVETIEPTIRLDTDFDSLRHPQMLLGHTCGYPLMRYLQHDCDPICVPVFDVDGCDGKYYSSHFIVHSDSDIDHLAQCRNHTAAINGPDSNSGMNVLRHALSRLDVQAPFFSQVIVSGTHLNSVKAVADKTATLAAIDSVSFALIRDEWPQLAAQVRTVGYSAQTCGLPIVTPTARRDEDDADSITHALNEALRGLSAECRNTLHLVEFETVTIEDYQRIVELERKAVAAGYSDLL